MSTGWERQQLRIIHLEIELDFAEEFTSYSISQQLYKALAGRPPHPVEKTPEPGVILRSPKRKQLVGWDTNSCRVAIESVTNPEECFSEMVVLLETINKVAPIGKLARKQLITYWLLPTENYSFKSLEQKYRQTLITEQPIWKNAFDSSVIIDIKVDDLILHHQSGPMGTRQLRDEYTIFKLENIPSIFIFLWTSILGDEVVEYSGQDIRTFLASSFEHCKYHSELFEGIWREIL